ncbi:AarF/UbiB family protein [Agromyces sp. NPDC049794]|uniref:ABC1 kinase family protein n=1 Tax=unclassified Agromyces TaxID=2639701 RepID=UPI0033C5F1AA
MWFTWVMVTALVAAYVVALGLVVRWLVGAPVGPARSLLTGLVAFFVLVPAVFLAIGGSGVVDTAGMARGQVSPGEVLVICVALLWVLGLGAAFLAALEIVWPSYRSVGIIARVRGGRDRWRRALRYLRIVRIAARHGLGPLLRGRQVRIEDVGPALVAALTDAGVTFVKLGQVLASRRDVVPPALAAHLSTLQTQVLPENWPAVERMLLAELDRPLAEVFANLEKTPLAAASIGQVHTGTLVSGEAVVVKVQRAHARSQVETDIDIALRLCARLEQRSPAARRIGLLRLMRDLAESLRDELDYRVEARNLSLMSAAADRAAATLRVPHLHPEFSTRRIITMERIDGEPLAAASSTLQTLTTAAQGSIAEQLVDGVLQQVLVDGVFHADLHAGNIMVCSDGTVALIDFGSVGIVDREQRDLLAAFLAAFNAEDVHSAVVAVRHLTAGGEFVDDRALHRDIGELFTIVSIERNTKVLTDRLLRLFHRHGLAVPGNLAAAVRTMATLQDAIETLDAASDYADLVLTRMQGVAARQADPRRLQLVGMSQAMTVSQFLRRLPDNLDAITEGNTARVTSRASTEQERRSWGLRVIAALGGCLFGLSLAAAALILILDGGGPSIPPGVPALPLMGWVIGFVALIAGTRSAMVLKRLTGERP